MVMPCLLEKNISLTSAQFSISSPVMAQIKYLAAKKTQRCLKLLIRIETLTNNHDLMFYAVIQIYIYYNKCCLTFLISLLNNFQRASMRNNKQKQKQKNELIFKYVKQLSPYTSNPEARVYYEKRLAKSCLKEPSIYINSKVYEVNIAESKHKKKVSFIDEPQVMAKTDLKREVKSSTLIQRTSKVSEKIKNNQNSSLLRQGYSSQSIHKDLKELQKSTFSAFKIIHKPEKAKQQPQPFYQNLPLSYSQNYSSLPGPKEQKTNDQVRLKDLWKNIERTKSASTISNLGIASQIKKKDENNPQTSIKKKGQSQMAISLSSIPTQITKNKASYSTRQIPLSNRSEIYSKQSHNLMVEIFRQKLQKKIGS